MKFMITSSSNFLFHYYFVDYFQLNHSQSQFSLLPKTSSLFKDMKYNYLYKNNLFSINE